MLDMNKFVSRQELMQETGICNTTISKYLRDLGMYHRSIPKEKKQEIVDYINERVRQARENSNAARRKGKSVYDRKISVRRNTPCDWRVSIRGSYGWIVVRVGTQDEMEPWAEMLMRNGIEARASRNECRKVVNS
jgi:transcriptional antiterminator